MKYTKTSTENENYGKKYVKHLTFSKIKKMLHNRVCLHQLACHQIHAMPSRPMAMHTVYTNVYRPHADQNSTHNYLDNIIFNHMYVHT